MLSMEGERMNKQRSSRRWYVMFVLLVVIVLVGTAASLASHNFTDVPTAAFYHDAVEWIANRGITGGCAPGLYCPLDAVNRAQMAVFMRALGLVLTPAFVRSGAGTGAVDPDASPVLCQTGGFTVSGYPRQARVHSWVSLDPAGSMSVLLEVVVSTNGGVSWSNPDAAPGFARAGASVAGEWVHAYKDALFDMVIGSTYLFGVRVGRDSGTADATAHRCTVTAEILNRNPSVSPLSVRGTRDGR